MINLPIEEVVWEDHFSTTDWTSKADVMEDQSVFVTSVGYRLKETKTKIVLIQNCADNDIVSNTMTILKKTVKSRTVIREKEVT